MNPDTPMIPINRDARRFLSRGKAIATLQSALCICSEKLSGFAAAADAARELNDFNDQVEWRIKVVKSGQTGQFRVEMNYRISKRVNKLVEMKHLEHTL